MQTLFDNQTLPGGYLFFDTETTGLPRNWSAPVSDIHNWPRIVQIAWELYDADLTLLASNSRIIKPEGYEIPLFASRIHGITTERARESGVALDLVLAEIKELLQRADYLVAHNVSFDEKVLGAEFLRKKMPNDLSGKKMICTKEISTQFCAIPGPYGYKWPKLSELYRTLFGTSFEDSHNAIADVRATAQCYIEMKRRGIVT